MKFSLGKRIPEEFRGPYLRGWSRSFGTVFSFLFRRKNRNYVSTGSVFVPSASINFFFLFFFLFFREERNITLLFHGTGFFASPFDDESHGFASTVLDIKSISLF